MAINEKILTIFVAYPEDVAEERAALDEVIREVNILWPRRLGIRLELISWDTHGHPGFATDAQEVINREMPPCDIFIGIAWTRMGTPTPRAESGTAEEFNIAYERFQENPKQLQIMFYFKDAPIPPSKIDPEQLARLRKFRERLREQGGLDWPFTSTDDFKNLVRVHLSLKIGEWGKSWGTSANAAPQLSGEPTQVSTSKVASSESEEEDEGYLDLEETAVAEFQKAQDAMKRIGEATNEHSAKVRQHAARLNEINARSGNVEEKKEAVNQAADELEHFAIRLQAEIPIFTDSISKGMNAYARSVTLLPYFHPKDYSQLKGAIRLLDDYKGAVKKSLDANLILRESIDSAPPVTARYNRAKRHALDALDDLNEQMERVLNLIPSVQKTMQEIIDRGKAA